MPPPAMEKPEYVCAIIVAADGRYLLQLRPAQAQHAPGQLTCFGGRRESGESTDACLLRELHEELAWRPTHMTPACDLIQGLRYIARFFHCPMAEVKPFTTEPGHVALWVPPAALPGLPISPWHRAVLGAVAAGQTRVDLPS